MQSFRISLIFPLVILIGIVLSCNGPTPKEISKEEIREEKIFYSTILKEERPYLVFVPKTRRIQKELFQPKKYPVLVLLDGDYLFEPAVEVIKKLSSKGIIPEMIVVSIHNTNRNRDLSPSPYKTVFNGKKIEDIETTGGGDNFLKFLSEELLPEIDELYSTIDLKILVGYNLGGLLAAHAFVQNNTPFKSFISVDPSLWWNNQEINKQIREKIDVNFSNSKSLYISSSNNSEAPTDTSITRRSQQAFFDAVMQKNKTNLQANFQLFEQENQSSVSLLALYEGLLFTFSRFKPKEDIGSDITKYISHYDKLSDFFGITILPTEEEINNLSYEHFKNNDKVLSYQFFKLYTKLYPKAWNGYDSLGEWYLANGDKEKAKICYKISVELNPDNQHGIDIINKIDNNFKVLF